VSRSLRITVLADNSVRRAGLLAEHGWACWVETPDVRVLFDTGQGHALLHNARAVSTPLQATQAIVLSHGHYDHTGSLEAVSALVPQARVFAHPGAFEAKYGRKPDGQVRDIGLPGDRLGIRGGLADRLVATTAPTEIGQDVFVTGPIPRTSMFEDVGGRFYLDEACQRPDPLVDDQALVMRTRAGTVVVLGCAHAGAINTLDYVRQLTDGEPIRAVIGGMHLGAASAERIERTIDALREREVMQVVAAHCTGAQAYAALWNGLPGRCTACEAGATFAW
jgi:7,8-dihydropterin-6-yl-methyl-4-(beta-D-ribofuranosyl)aminobenzene 5'-phosphate synthase